MKQLDLADLTSVDGFAKNVVATEPRLDLLILNAGIMAVPLSYTSAGFESQIGTNNFGHFALTTALLDKMKAQVPASLVLGVSSANFLVSIAPVPCPSPLFPIPLHVCLILPPRVEAG